MGIFSKPPNPQQQAQQEWQSLVLPAMQLQNQYNEQQQGALRNAIVGMGPNPYFQTGSELNPSAYRIDPKAMAYFGNRGPGMNYGQPRVAMGPSQQAMPPPPMLPMPKPPPPPPPPTGVAVLPPPTGGQHNGPPPGHGGTTIPLDAFAPRGARA